MYEPTNWKTGDVVTSAKLNKLEQGVANSGVVVHITITQEGNTITYTLDKTYRQIKDALESGVLPIILEDGGNGLYRVSGVTYFGFNASQNVYGVGVNSGVLTDAPLTTSTEDGYPTASVQRS